jgi:hypothetical protein
MSLNLIDPVDEILEKVKELTGKHIKFIERNDLPTDATLKLARKNMPSHLILYKAEHDEAINHLIAHECGHALRMFAAPEEKRLIPSTHEQVKRNALAEIEPEVQRLSSVFPSDRLAEVVNLWYSGIIRQLTNLPPDIMVEKWIYDGYPVLRPYQSATQRRCCRLIGASSEDDTPKNSRRIQYHELRLLPNSRNALWGQLCQAIQ